MHPSLSPNPNPDPSPSPTPTPTPNSNPNQARIHSFAAEAGLAPSRSWSDDTYLLVELRAPAATE